MDGKLRIWMGLGFHRCWDCMKHYKTICDDFVYFFQSNIFKYMIEFYKRNMSHLDNLSLFLNLEQKYSSIYHCALHKNQFCKPCLPYVFAYKEDILPSLAFYSILWQSKFSIDYYQNSIIVHHLCQLLLIT